MRIAVSGTHCMGKTTFIEDFVAKYSDYKYIDEAYYHLQYDEEMELSLEPSLDNVLAQLDVSIAQLQEYKDQSNVIFDRLPIDCIAYGMCALLSQQMDVHNNALIERFADVKATLDSLDLILFLPLLQESPPLNTHNAHPAAKE